MFDKWMLDKPRAALEYLRASFQQPHIIQVHDWHTAAVPLLYWTVRAPVGTVV
jgi:glycogen synthase